MGEIQSRQNLTPPPPERLSLLLGVGVVITLVIYLLIEAFLDTSHIISLLAVIILVVILYNYLRSLQKGHQINLAESEERFQAIATIAPVLIWMSDTDKGGSWFNKIWLDYTGRTMEQEIGSGWTESVHPDDLDRCLRIYNAAFDAREPFSMEYRLRRHDGVYRWMLDNGTPRYDHAGGFLGYIGSCIDVNERRESETRLETMLDNMPVLLLANSADPLPLMWNKEAERVSGYSAAEMINNPHALELVYPDQSERSRLSELGKTRRGDYRDEEFTLTTKSGEKRTISWTSVAKHAPIPGWASWSVGVDVTARKRAEQRTQVLQHLTDALSKPLTTKQVAETLVNVGLMILGGFTGAVYLVRPDKEWADLIAHRTGFETLYTAFMSVPLDSPIPVADAIRRKEALFIENQQDYLEQYPQYESIIRTQDLRSIIILLLKIDTEVVGAITMSFSEDRQFDSEDRALFNAIAQQCAQALERARLYETERNARAAAEAAQRQIALITDNLPVLIAYVDRDLRFRFVNHSYEVWFKQPRAEIEGKTKRELVGETAYAILEPHIRRVLQGEYVQFDTQIVYNVAGERYVSETYVPDIDAAGNTRGFFVLIQDISAHRHAEERIWLLQRLTATLSAPLTIKEVAEATIQDGLIHAEGLTGAVYLLSDDRQQIQLAGHKQGMEQWYASAQTVPIEVASPATDVIRTRTPIFLESQTACLSAFPELTTVIHERDIHAMVGIPIFIKGEAIGSISISYNQPRTFTSDDRALFAAIAQQCGQAMERARLYETERDARTAAEAAQRQIALITDNLPVLIAYVDRDLRYRFVNFCYEMWFKQPRTDIYGKTKRELIGEAAFAVLEPYIERVLTGEIVEFEAYLDYDRAGARYVDETYIPDVDESGQTRGFFVLVQDVSDRRRAEERTQILQRLTAELSAPLTLKDVAQAAVQHGLVHMNGLTGAVYLLSDDSQQLDMMAVKTGAEQWYSGVASVPFALPTPLSDVIRTHTPLFFESQDEYVQAYPMYEAAIRQTGMSAIIAFPIMVKGEPVGTISISYNQPRTFSADDRALIAAIAQQTGQAMERARLYETEHAARTAAEAARRQVTLITDNLPALIAYVDRDLRYQFVNHYYEVWFKQPRAEIYGKTKRELVGEAAYAVLEPHVERVLNGEFVHFESYLVYNAAGERYVSEIYVPDVDETGYTRGFFVLIQDMSDRRRAEERTQILQRLTAALSTPLTIKEVSEVIVNQGLAHMNGFTGAVYLLSDDRQQLELIARREDAKALYAPFTTIPVNTPSPLTEAVRAREPMFIESQDDYVRYFPMYEAQIRQLNASALMALPIIIDDEATGAISISFNEPRAFSTEDRALINAIVQQCAQALERARLYETERAARTAAEAAQFQLRLITDNIPALVSQIDRQQRYRYVNATYEQWFGDRREDIAGKTMLEVLGSDAYDVLRPYIEAALRGEPTYFEALVNYRHAGERYIQAAYIPNMDKDGTIQGFFVLINDLTERRRAEERTQILQQLTAALAQPLTVQAVAETIVSAGLQKLSTLTGAIFLFDADHSHLLLTAHREGLSDFYEPYTRVPISLSVPLTDGARENRAIFIESAEEYIERYPHLEPVIRQTSIQAIVTLPLEINGEVIGALTMSYIKPRAFLPEDRAMMTAVAQQCAQALERVRYYEAERTARAAAEAAALENERLYRSEQIQREYWRVTLASIGDAVIVTDETGSVTFLNSVAENLTGWQLDEASGRSLDEVFRIINEHTRLPVESPVEKVLSEGVTVGLANHTVLITKTGSEVPIDDSGAPIHDDRNTIIGVVLVFRDITERKRIEAEREHLLEQERYARREAEHADMLKLRFLGMISHELRTPLASIKGFSSTLLAEDVTWDEQSQHGFITIIEQEADKLTGLVDQLLDLSRLQAGTLRIFALPHRLSHIIQIARPQLNTLAADHRLIIDIPDDLPLVMVDDQRIAQVLTNLVSNSAKFSPPNTTITVEASVKVYGEPVIQIDVTDEGSGIPIDARAYVFEAFRQIEQSSTALKGAGLGLAICKALVEGHSGQIWIADDYPGIDDRGTRLSFTLPIATDEDLAKVRE